VKSRELLIELLPDRLDVVLYDGAKVKRSHRVTGITWTANGDWKEDIRQCGERLAKVVEELECGGMPARVLYHSPTQAVDYAGFPIKSPAHVADAARLGCLDSLAYAAESPVCLATIIGRDGAGERKLTHTVVVADRDDMLGALATMVKSSGLQFLGATPRAAVIMAHTVDHALERSAESRGYLFLGEDSSFFCIVGDRALQFGRRISLGLSSLVNGLTRPIQISPDEEPVVLSAESARVILFQHGYPDRGTVVCDSPEIRGGQIIPFMQPILQRFVIEMRQSVRFGLPPERRDGLPITVLGPGGALPGLAELFGRELGVEAEAGAECAAYDDHDPGSPGSVAAACVQDPCAGDEMRLFPGTLMQSRRAGTIRRWLWTGAAASVAVIGIDTVQYEAQLRSARPQAEVLKQSAQEMASFRETRDRLEKALSAVRDLETQMLDEIGVQSNYRAVLQEISMVTPPAIRLLSLNLGEEKGNHVGDMTGFVMDPRVSSEQGGLDAFVMALRESPLFDGVELNHVQQGAIGGVERSRFEISFRSVESPTVVPWNQVVQVEGEEAP